jgi:hypothetical protein
MFEVGFMELERFLATRPEALVPAVLWADERFVAGLAPARPADLARLAVRALPSATFPVLSPPPPTLGVSPLQPKAARTVANASSSESWRVSTVIFMRVLLGRE